MKKIILIIITCALLISCTKKNNIDYNKYEMLTLAKEISNYYGLNIDTSGVWENASIKKYWDGSYELNYTYDLRETEDYIPLYYSISISKESSTKEALSSYLVTKTTALATNNAIGQEVSAIDSIALPGDQNYYAIRTIKDEPSGIFLIIRKNDRIYTLIMSGLYSSDHSLVKELILPKIENLESFEIID